MFGRSLHLPKLHTLQIHIHSVLSRDNILLGLTMPMSVVMHDFFASAILPALENLSIAISVRHDSELMSDPYWPRVETVLSQSGFQAIKSIRIRAYEQPQKRFIPISADVMRLLFSTLALRPGVDFSPLSFTSCVL